MSPAWLTAAMFIWAQLAACRQQPMQESTFDDLELLVKKYMAGKQGYSVQVPRQRGKGRARRLLPGSRGL